MDTLNQSHLENAKQLIYAINLDPVIDRLVKVDKWTKQQAIDAIKQYRNYLFLKRKYGETYAFPPSHDIDEVWHAHVLHTKDYFDFCEKAFGTYLHHHPHHGSNNELTEEDISFAFENETQRLYFNEFGEYIESIQPIPFFLIIKRFFEYLKTCMKNQRIHSDTMEVV